ncbi:MAG TPA: hypothetical protein VMU87_02105 [Stellaceae bacterium]|nr:hypothetical protein [Stellaceae bacterium]
MATTSPHEAEERRLAQLGERIVALKRQLAADSRSDKSAEIAALEQRHGDLTARLHALHLEGPSFRSETKAALVRVADDVSASLDEWVSWVDSGYAADRQPSDKAPRRQG